MIHNMKRQILLRALTFGVSASALILTSCNTTESRISKHPEIFQRLSPRDQALVSQGKIREGMTQDAVWLAWGSPDQKATGTARGQAAAVRPVGAVGDEVDAQLAPLGPCRY